MYVTFADPARTTSDLAANLTDRALELLAGADTGSDSVATELRLWHTLRAELEREFRRPRAVRSRGEVLQQVVRRAARWVVGEGLDTSEDQGRHAEYAASSLCHA